MYIKYFSNFRTEQDSKPFTLAAEQLDKHSTLVPDEIGKHSTLAAELLDDKHSILEAATKACTPNKPLTSTPIKM